MKQLLLFQKNKSLLGRQIPVLLTVLLIGVLGFTGPSQAQGAGGEEETCPEYFFNATAANDFFPFGGRTDRHFTQGLRFSLVERLGQPTTDGRRYGAESCQPKCCLGRGALGVYRFFSGLTRKVGDATLGKLFGFDTDTVSVIVGQNIYTPEDLSQIGLIEADQPYAGWLYMGFGLFHEKKHQSLPILGSVDSLDSVEIDLGVIGPGSLAEDAQSKWHDIINDPDDPKGWDNQLGNEFALLINYDRRYRKSIWKEGPWGVDVLPGGGFAMGNVFIHGSAGSMVRVGRHLPRDYGPPRIRPGAQGSDFFATGPKIRNKATYYFYTGVEGRAVARNIFLDGNTFKNSHATNKRYFVGDFQFGGVWAYKRWRLAYTQVYRSQEFKGQLKADSFGTVTISYQFGR